MIIKFNMQRFSLSQKKKKKLLEKKNKCKNKAPCLKRNIDGTNFNYRSFHHERKGCFDQWPEVPK